jgi:hypothetical protein
MDRIVIRTDASKSDNRLRTDQQGRLDHEINIT